MNKTILVTGGCGYIGAHTIVDLLQHGYEVVNIDNNSRSTDRLLDGIEKITGKKFITHHTDLCDLEETRKIFRQYAVTGIIHFAAYKSVDESVLKPLEYYRNNLQSQLNMLSCTEEFNIPYFVFSSTCSVYGNAREIPVTEKTPLGLAESPYGRTKQIGEDMIRDLAKVSKTKFVLLRYFNPVGAHPSAAIGEIPFGKPANLVPAITQFAIGKIPQLKVYGTDYDTRDGSCIRDYIHICDIAHAHTLAMDHLLANKSDNNCEVYNLGTGNGVTVLEAIHAFENVTGKKLNYTQTARRPGDVVAVYANNDKARKNLNWKTEYNLEDMMRTAWKWEQAMQKDQ